MNNNEEKQGFVYFLTDGKFIRIGKTKNLESRLKSHISSNCDIEIYSVYQMPISQMDDEETICHDHFAEYRIDRDHSESFYDMKIKPMINDFITSRNHDIVTTQMKMNKRRTKIISTLFDGVKKLIEEYPFCSIFGWLRAARVCNPNSKTGNMNVRGYYSYDTKDPFNMSKRVFKPLSERGKLIFQDIVRTVLIELAMVKRKNRYIDMLKNQNPSLDIFDEQIKEEENIPTLETFF